MTRANRVAPAARINRNVALTQRGNNHNNKTRVERIGNSCGCLYYYQHRRCGYLLFIYTRTRFRTELKYIHFVAGSVLVINNVSVHLPQCSQLAP